MDSFITPSLLHSVLNDSLQHEDLNDATNTSTSLQRVLNINDTVKATHYVSITHFASFLMCVLGIPGNLLVIAVYVRKMTTSTRVYMFALAVSDLSVCIFGIVLTTVKFDNISQVITLYCAYTSVMFSVFLLAFVSIERLLAVRRPHTFSLSSLRAKRALVVIAVVAAVCVLVVTVARIKHYTRLRQVSLAVIIVSNVVVMVVCYTLMAVTMLTCWTPLWLSEVGFTVPRELIPMYILNSVVNPFIYSVMSGMFRDDVRLFYRQVRSWLTTRH
ncbi:hypothetical protein LSAT2_024974, partial [Lamellibrachia satsuma]